MYCGNGYACSTTSGWRYNFIESELEFIEVNHAFAVVIVGHYAWMSVHLYNATYYYQTTISVVKVDDTLNGRSPRKD